MLKASLARMQAILRPVIHWARLLFTPLALIVIAWFIWQSRYSLAEILQEANWSMLGLALFLWLVTNLISPLVTKYLLKACGILIDYSTTMEIHCRRLPAKYLPGGIWHSVGRANDYYGLGHAPKKIGIYFFLENFLIVAVTLCMSALIVHNLIKMPVVQTMVYFLPAIMGSALLSLPFVANKFLNSTELFSAVDYFAAVACIVLYWCVVGLAFACFISAFDELGISSTLIQMAGIYIFSWSLGYLALFAPQGIGVSEFIAGNLLSNGAHAGQVVVFLAGFRLLVLLADMISWLMVELFKPRFKAK